MPKNEVIKVNEQVNNKICYIKKEEPKHLPPTLGSKSRKIIDGEHKIALPQVKYTNETLAKLQDDKLTPTVITPKKPSVIGAKTVIGNRIEVLDKTVTITPKSDQTVKSVSAIPKTIVINNVIDNNIKTSSYSTPTKSLQVKGLTADTNIGGTVNANQFSAKFSTNNSKLPYYYNPRKLKIAVIFRGLAYHKCYYSNHTLQYTKIDYRASLDNYRDKLFDGNDVDVFFHTYRTDGLDEGQLINELKPKAYEITDLLPESTAKEYGNRPRSLTNTMSRALDVFIKYSDEHKPKYDFVIFTRFDLCFKMKLSNLPLEHNKFMISCMCEVKNLCDDNFFIFEQTHASKFKHIIDTFDLNKNLVHHVYEDLVKTFNNNVKILIPGSYIINVGTPLYNIMRIKAF